MVTLSIPISLTAAKVLAAVLIFALALIAGLLPIRLANTRQHLISIADAFAGGVFLSASFLHMLPDALEGFHVALPNMAYPIALLVVMLTFFMLFVLEHSNLFIQREHSVEHRATTPYLLALLLGVHSILEGAAIGINTHLADAAVIFFAVLAHKGSESFALAIKLYRYAVNTKQVVKVIILFACMTPLGIFIAMYACSILQNNAALLAAAIFNALAAGTFLYIGAVHIIGEPDNIFCRCGMISLLSGMALMAVVAIWV
jgi:zinc transporter 1/2/3